MTQLRWIFLGSGGGVELGGSCNRPHASVREELLLLRSCLAEMEEVAATAAAAAVVVAVVAAAAVTRAAAYAQRRQRQKQKLVRMNGLKYVMHAVEW